RGSLVSLDAATGRQIWKTFTVPDEPRPTITNARGTQQYGPSGVGVWSAPALDPDRNRVYVGTGNNYSNPPTAGSDAIVAFAMDTGRIIWAQQTLAGDASAAPGDNAGPDHDYSSSPVLTVFPDGRRVLLAGQKSGVLHALDPESGELIWKTRAGEGGILGGI